MKFPHVMTQLKLMTLGLLVTSIAVAQQQTAVPSLQAPAPVMPSTSASYLLEAKLDLGTSRTVGVTEDKDVNWRWSYLEVSSLYHPWAMGAYAVGGYNQSMSIVSGEQVGSFDNILVGAYRKLEIQGLDNFKIGFAMTLPVNEDTQRMGFQGSIAPHVEFSKRFGRIKTIGLFGYSRGFLAEQSRALDAIGQDAAKAGFGFDYGLTEKWLASVSLQAHHAWVTPLEQAQSRTSWSVTTSYDFTSQISFLGGVSRGSSVLGADAMKDQVDAQGGPSQQVFVDMILTI